MIMDMKSAAKAIKQGQVSPIYVLYGTEKYRMKELCDVLEQQLLDPQDRDFAIVSYDLAETPIQEVVEEAETLPFMVPRKLIYVKDSSLFTAAKESGKLEHRVETLLDYMSNPAEYSVIVFMVHQEKLDERKKLVKLAKSSGVVLSFSPLNGEELLKWVEQEASRRHCQMAPGAADTLIRNAGTQLQTLSAELDKLCLYAGEGAQITSEIVDQLVARTTEQNIFVMIEDIANLRLDKALGIFYELLKQREEPIKIAALITRQFRIILQVKDLSAQSYSQQQIASSLSLHPYAVKIAAEQARKFDSGQLKNIIHRLTELDFMMKTGRIDKVLGLELFLLRLGA